jgi:hypothetical protein
MMSTSNALVRLSVAVFLCGGFAVAQVQAQDRAA